MGAFVGGGQGGARSRSSLQAVFGGFRDLLRAPPQTWVGASGQGLPGGKLGVAYIHPSALLQTGQQLTSTTNLSIMLLAVPRLHSRSYTRPCRSQKMTWESLIGRSLHSRPVSLMLASTGCTDLSHASASSCSSKGQTHTRRPGKAKAA